MYNLPKYEVQVSAKERAQYAEQAEIDAQQDAINEKRGIKRKGNSPSEEMRIGWEVRAELAAIDARLAALDAVIVPEERRARGAGALATLINEQIANVDKIARQRLQEAMLRLARGETFDLLAFLHEAHPAALAVLCMDTAARRALAQELHEPASGTNTKRHPDMDVRHRLADLLAERNHWLDRRRELAPTEADLALARQREALLRGGIVIPR